MHFDVSALDSADLPLANYPHHDKGQTLATAVMVSRRLTGTAHQVPAADSRQRGRARFGRPQATAQIVPETGTLAQEPSESGEVAGAYAVAGHVHAKAVARNRRFASGWPTSWAPPPGV